MLLPPVAKRQSLEPAVLNLMAKLAFGRVAELASEMVEVLGVMADGREVQWAIADTR